MTTQPQTPYDAEIASLREILRLSGSELTVYVNRRIGYRRAVADYADLLAACEDIVKAHDVGMGKTAVALRIDLARAAIAKAKGEGA